MLTIGVAQSFNTFVAALLSSLKVLDISAGRLVQKLRTPADHMSALWITFGSGTTNQAFHLAYAGGYSALAF